MKQLSIAILSAAFVVGLASAAAACGWSAEKQSVEADTDRVTVASGPQSTPKDAPSN
jgi:hypothetical protein